MSNVLWLNGLALFALGKRVMASAFYSCGGWCCVGYGHIASVPDHFSSTAFHGMADKAWLHFQGDAEATMKYEVSDRIAGAFDAALCDMTKKDAPI